MFRWHSFSARRHTWTISAAVAVLFLACGQASAQSSAPAPVLPPLERPQEPDTASRRGRLHIGPLQLRPGFGLNDLGIDTNVFNSRTDRQQDFTFAAGPTAEARLELGRFRLTGDGDLAYVYYHRFENQRSFNRTITGLAEIRLTRRLLFYARDSFANTKERLNLEVDARARRIEKSIQSGVVIGVSRKVSMELAGTLSERRFADDAVIQDVKLNETLGADSRSAAARLAFMVTPLTTLFVTGESVETRYPLSPNRDLYETSFVVGAAFKPKALVDGYARIGVQRGHMLNIDRLHHTGVLANFDLRYRPKDGTELGLVLRRHRESSFEKDSPYSVLYGAGGSIRQHLFGQVDLYLLAEREMRTYLQFPSADELSLDATGTDHVDRYTGTVGVNSVRNFGVYAGLEYVRRSGKRLFAREYDGLRLTAMVSVGRFRVGNRQGAAAGGRQ